MNPWWWRQYAPLKRQGFIPDDGGSTHLWNVRDESLMMEAVRTSQTSGMNPWWWRQYAPLKRQGFIPDDGGSTHLWNVGRQSFYTAVYPRRQLWTWKKHVFGLFSIVQYFLKKLDLLPSSGKIELASVTGPAMRLALRHPTEQGTFILTEDGNRSSFRNVVFWENIGRWTKSKNVFLWSAVCIVCMSCCPT
jgi:hypothetical protein